MILPKHIPTALSDKEAEFLYAYCLGKKVLEIGSLLGYSTIVLAQSAKCVVSVDSHEGYPEDNPRSTLVPFLENIKQYPNIIPVIRNYDASLGFLLGNFDVVFIDAMGTYGSTNELLTFVNAYNSTNIIVHDYGHEKWTGATQAVDRYRDRTESMIAIVDTLAVLKK